MKLNLFIIVSIALSSLLKWHLSRCQKGLLQNSLFCVFSAIFCHLRSTQVPRHISVLPGTTPFCTNSEIALGYVISKADWQLLWRYLRKSLQSTETKINGSFCSVSPLQENIGWVWVWVTRTKGRRHAEFHLLFINSLFVC